ncbi:carboxypeptidase-like regulatory domain-containing protein [Curtobacterium sp. 9128]|uniref:carboxypeptidase-like regulatory domain-containing protein n=1 Tax=Curtobacterium sp. 9128 TaxID=1793722 RepID=UPI0011A8DCC6|nr:carboxypeptidase-like regulatory domain-containing protein [Curtobacterium sp. 9128]
MRRWRMITAGVTGIALGAGLALGGVVSASAETTGHWGAFAVSGASKAFTGSVALPGFPATTFTSTASSANVIGGASTWQSAATGPGAIYGSSRGNSYINLRPAANNATSPSVTTYSFAAPTPAGGWSFVLGDVDADQATISAVVQGGGAATGAQLGYQSSYNSCSVESAGGPSCDPDPDGTTGRDVPNWNEGTRTLTGNAAAADTDGASAWFTPTVPLESLTISYQWRSGFPVYQTWFANRTSALSGAATLDGAALPDTLVTATAPGGAEFTTTTDGDGRYSFPELTQADGYRVTIATPAGATAQTAPGPVDLRRDVTGVDFAFATPPATVALTGTVVDSGGRPVADATVTVQDATTGAVLLQTTTDADGTYAAPGLPSGRAVDVSATDTQTERVTTGAVGAADVVVPPLVLPAPASTIAGQVLVDGAAPSAPVLVELLQGDQVVATTDTAADGSYAFTVVAGTYTVRTTAPSTGASGETDQTVTTTAGGASTVDFRFVTPVPVTVSQAGSVRYGDGTAIAGATVTAQPAEAGSGAVVTVTTGADGSYDLTGLTPGTVYVLSTAGADDQTVTTVATGAAPTPVDFVLPLPTVDQPGTVTTSDGAPATGVPVVATPAGGAAVTATTAADGSFDLTGLAPSTEYSVVAGTGDTASAPRTVTTAAVGGTPTPLAIVLRAAVVAPPTGTPTVPPGSSVPPVSSGSAPGSTGGGSSSTGPLAFTGADVAPAAIAAGVLVLLGGGLLTFRSARRRRTDGRRRAPSAY